MDQEDTTPTGVHLRPRRGQHQFWQIWLRVPAAIYALVVLIYLGYYIGRWNGVTDPWTGRHEDAGGEAAAALSAAILSLLLSALEIHQYVGKMRTNPLSGYIICLDVLVIAVAAGGFARLLLANWNSYPPSSYPVPDRPWLGDQALATWLAMGLLLMHSLYSIMGCCGCCFGQASPPKRPKPARAQDPPAAEDASQPDVAEEPAPPEYQQYELQDVELQEPAHKGPPPEYPGPNTGQSSSH